MAKYKINKKTSFREGPNADGIIVIEYPHYYQPSVWYALDEKDFISKINNFTTEDFDLSTFQGCKEFLSHDLRNLEIIRFSSLTEEDLIDPDEDALNVVSIEVADAMLHLGWILIDDEEDEEVDA